MGLKRVVVMGAVSDCGVRRYSVTLQEETRRPGARAGRGCDLRAVPRGVSRLMELFCVSTAAVATGLHVSINTHISLCPEERVFTKCTLKIKFLKTKREKILRDEQ